MLDLLVIIYWGLDYTGVVSVDMSLITYRYDYFFLKFVAFIVFVVSYFTFLLYQVLSEIKDVTSFYILTNIYNY